MRRRLTTNLTYANVMATVAVFIALGGGAYAAIKLPPNSVGTKQVKKSAITSAKVKDRSLMALDFKAGQLRAGTQGPKGDTGAQGPKGDTGAAGPQGERGPSFGDTATGSTVFIPSGCQTKDITSKTFTVPQRSRIFATAEAEHYGNGSAGVAPYFAVQLTKAGSATVVADLDPVYRGPSEAAFDEFWGFPTGVLRSVPGGSAFEAAPGDYTLTLKVSAYGTCAANNTTARGTLSYVLLGTG